MLQREGFVLACCTFDPIVVGRRWLFVIAAGAPTASALVTEIANICIVGVCVVIVTINAVLITAKPAKHM